MDFIAPFVLHRKNNLFKVIAVLVAVLCLTGALSQTVLAENTYVITDGDAVKVHTSYAQNPARVLQEAGVDLATEDMYVTQLSDGVSEITVQRLQTITVQYDQEVFQANSYGETLEELFIRLGITVDNTVAVSEPLDTPTYDGMLVRVDNVQESIERYTVDIPFETTYCEDPSLPEGEEKVLVTGCVGQMVCTATVRYVNRQETARTVIAQTVVQEPVAQVIAVGTGAEVAQTQPIIGDGVIILPTGEVLTYTHTDQFVATAYTKTDAGCDDITANGAQVKIGVVAVDPAVIPYGTRMFIVSNDGAYFYGLSTAEDCGGAIVEKRLDLYFDTTYDCFQFGVRDCTVYFLGGANWWGTE